ncbi:NPCBM/NEW2 domain-containing protein [Arthrobacter sp. CJ23]|uniref:NPCBM/NEW2 domain-containing protein n=1 Tax=Arthrobacter sp. CJ23 TaxID=2972479 RepID=UPI00215C63D7|nr:NPCBM/NEW2 domain-containing protein [Arthrobacter sp. CJ23]UVJ39608.1 NPCBM/NEW2 domain-containing protein [Arthrobacter sp. CJ23]
MSAPSQGLSGAVRTGTTGTLSCLGRKAAALGLASLLLAAAVPALTFPAAANAAPGDPAAIKTVTPEVPVDSAGVPLGAITGFTQAGNVVDLATEAGAIRVTFLDDGNFRLEADPTGTFTDPANTDQGDPARTANIVVGKDKFPGTTPAVTDGDWIVLSTAKVSLHVNKATTQLKLLRADGSLVFAESAPITFGAKSATQHLAPQDGEQFIGGGMQNGRSVHTGALINIARNFDWDDDGYPNAVPYYMSNKGYGVLRDTFARGSYDFGNQPTSTHEERRFDAYYFVGDYKQSLNSYTTLTGKPLMPPVYALEYGDADCYNRSNPGYSSSGFGDPDGAKQRTPDAIKTARKFVENDMPAGWMLVNDGYGCEYQQLPETVDSIEEETDLKVGLWTQRSLTNQEYEVGEAGVRMRKLDVAWVGQGYRQALTGCQAAHDGIEQYSTSRGTSLMVEGWAGAQRCGMQWTGDHSGNLDAVRWQVSALTGAGNSGFAFSTGDVDGIFGGSAESYVRDLQWKAFAPALYSMSGWAAKDKRPWLYGDEATAINRQYLQLRQQLMPFIYTLAQESSATGVSMMRSMALEFPEQQWSYGAEANNQFMLGSDFLVAPVFTQTDVRNGIFLPAGQQWVDYWTGKLYQGGQILNGYNAPLDKLPVFVRAGAVVPQGIVARNASLVAEDSPITLDIYAKGKNTFMLYEDDKVSREYKDGKASRQLFEVEAPDYGPGTVSVKINTRDGDYAGKAAARPYQLTVHAGEAPRDVQVGGNLLAKLADKAAFEAATTGWYFDGANNGTVHVKTGPIASDKTATVLLKQAGPLGGRSQEGTAAELRVTTGQQVFQDQEATVTAEFVNTGKQAKNNVRLTPALPEGWTVKSATGDSAASVGGGQSITATFVVSPGAASKAGAQTVRFSASYAAADGTPQTVAGANQIYVAYGSLAAAYNNISVTTVANKALGNFDGGGATFSAEQLAAAAVPAGGVRPGSTVTVNAGTPKQVDFTWPAVGPDVPNAVALSAQTIAVTGQGTHLAVLGSAAVGNGTSPTLTLSYKDGTTEKQSIFFPNWLQPSVLNGAVVAVSEQGRNNANGPSPEYTQYKYQAFANTVRLNPTKELASVTLPTDTRVKFFDWKVTTQPLPEVPHGAVYASETPWVQALNGYGVIGKNVANKDSASSPDKPLAINYTDPATGLQPGYAKGLGVHAASRITYYLGGKCSSFTAQVGLESGFGGNIIFKVDADGVNKYQSRTYTPGFAPESVTVDLSGVAYVDVIVDPSGSINGAHGVWGDAKFTCAP